MATPTLADSLTAATAALTANAEAYLALENRVALREAYLVKLGGGAPTDADPTELARFSARGILLGPLGAQPNALAGTLPGALAVPGIEAWVRLRGIALQSNTATAVTMTVAWAGGGFLTGNLLRRDGSVLAVGDIPVGVPFTFQPDGNGAFRMAEAVTSEILTSLTPSITNVSTTIVNAAVAGLRAVPFKKYVAGTYQVPIPAGATGCRSKLWGGGGGGGGVGSVGNGSGSAGGGGGYSFKTITGLVGGGTLNLVIGAGGLAGGAGGAGGGGGTTTLGSIHSAAGGYGGSANAVGTGGAGGQGFSGDVNLTGGYGSAGGISGSATGGNGGGAPLGGQGGGGAPGIAAGGTAPGGGGGGSGSSTVNPGTPGADGGAELEWF